MLGRGAMLLGRGRSDVLLSRRPRLLRVMSGGARMGRQDCGSGCWKWSPSGPSRHPWATQELILVLLQLLFPPREWEQMGPPISRVFSVCLYGNHAVGLGQFEGPVSGTQRCEWLKYLWHGLQEEGRSGVRELCVKGRNGTQGLDERREAGRCVGLAAGCSLTPRAELLGCEHGSCVVLRQTRASWCGLNTQRTALSQWWLSRFSSQEWK